MPDAFAADWSRRENEIVVDAYLGMLTDELQGVPFVKTRVNARVQQATGRGRGAIEFKFQNVSAVLNNMRHPFVRGYKLMSNIQDALVGAVLEGLASRPELEQAAVRAVSQPVEPEGNAVDFQLSEAPEAEERPEVRPPPRTAIKRDYVDLEQRNAALGRAGEVAVVRWERRRLIDLGLAQLAEAVEHVSDTRGDGLGYDVLSYEADGRPRFIEVKTTRQGRRWPMLISRNEVDFSSMNPDAYYLYRVYAFGSRRPGLYILPGSALDTCSLTPMVYEAVPSLRAPATVMSQATVRGLRP